MVVGGHTRLVTHYRASTPSHLAALLVDPLFELAVFAMTRRWLLGVEARAERRDRVVIDASSRSC